MSALLLLIPFWVRLSLVHGELPVQESLLRASRQPSQRERQMVVPSSSQISLLFRLKGTREKNDLTALGPSRSILTLFHHWWCASAHVRLLSKEIVPTV